MIVRLFGDRGWTRKRVDGQQFNRFTPTSKEHNLTHFTFKSHTHLNEWTSSPRDELPTNQPINQPTKFQLIKSNVNFTKDDDVHLFISVANLSLQLLSWFPIIQSFTTSFLLNPLSPTLHHLNRTFLIYDRHPLESPFMETNPIQPKLIEPCIIKPSALERFHASNL